ncbi:SET domain containing protein [Babesia ovata]|uniref:SET domain containing protein n=1 Tax=Babesia ovata TaxID=189622 RepID=A0A2H6KHJ9_9APIC|nr:SET domain containing protein [Babesia ovata]GBE62451.1 SET domain containing protein [Babesia ovata]
MYIRLITIVAACWLLIVATFHGYHCRKCSVSFDRGSKRLTVQRKTTFAAAYLSRNSVWNVDVYGISAKKSLHAIQDDGNNSKSTEPLVTGVWNTLAKTGTVASPLVVETTSRLEYNRTAILDTFNAAKKADTALTGNTFGEIDQQFFARFDGDNGAERSIVAEQVIGPAVEIVKVPYRFLLSLSDIRGDLISNHSLLQKQPPKDDVLHAYLAHIENLKRLNLGQLMTEPARCCSNDDETTNENLIGIRHDKDRHVCESFDRSTHSGSNIDVESTCNGDLGVNGNIATGHSGDGFEERLSALIASKKLSMLRTLLIADSVLSTGDAITVALENKTYELMHLNRNERELLLLSLGLAGLYQRAIFSFVMHLLHDPFAIPTLCEADVVRLNWVHHLLTKDMGHLPMLMPVSAYNQIQEPIVCHRLRQRLIAVNDAMTAALDPLSVVQDRIEQLSQAHYKVEDTTPLQSGCGPLMENRKINAELAMEEIESEILAFQGGKDSTVHTAPFEWSIDDVHGLLAGEDRPSFEPTEKADFVDVSSAFESYLTGTLQPQLYKHVSPSSWLQAINNVITQRTFTKLFASVVAHNIRTIGRVENSAGDDYTKRSFLHNRAPGIMAKLTTGSPSDSMSVGVEEKESYIVPFLDLVNHDSADPNCTIEMDSSGGGGFILKSLRAIQPGEELRVNYGNWDNNVFLLDYGMLPPLQQDQGVLMEVEPALIARAAESTGMKELLPRSFPAGLPLEKRNLLLRVNLFEIPSDKGFLNLYNEPYFEGMPVEMYNEFASKFLARHNSNHPAFDDDIDMESIRQEKSEYHPVTGEIFDSEEVTGGKEPMKLIKISADGVPDERLIWALKICFCRTKKRLQWLEQQDPKYLATSVNSPLDIDVFKAASLVCCEYVKSKYRTTILDDLRKVSNKEVIAANSVAGGSSTSLEKLRKCNTVEIPNAMIACHALRAKMPLYKCASYLESIGRDFDRNVVH